MSRGFRSRYSMPSLSEITTDTNANNSLLSLSVPVLAANAVGTSLELTPPLNYPNNEIAFTVIRSVSDVASATNGVWQEGYVSGAWTRMPSTTSSSANTVSSMTAIYGNLPYPVRLRYGNGAAAQGFWSVAAYMQPRQGSYPPVDLTGLSSIGAGETKYSQNLDVTQLGLWQNCTLHLICSGSLSVWREQLIDGVWERDHLTAIVSAALTGQINIPAFNQPYSPTVRFAAKNSGGSTVTVSMATVCGRGD